MGGMMGGGGGPMSAMAGVGAAMQGAPFQAAASPQGSMMNSLGQPGAGLQGLMGGGMTQNGFPNGLMSQVGAEEDQPRDESEMSQVDCECENDSES